jgi:hypothetical protein
VSAKTIINEVKRVCHKEFWDSSTKKRSMIRDDGPGRVAGIFGFDACDGLAGADRASSSGKTAELDGCADVIILDVAEHSGWELWPPGGGL